MKKFIICLFLALSLTGVITIMDNQVEAKSMSEQYTEERTQVRASHILVSSEESALALKNILGLTCDPVCGLVEVPCIKRNAFLAMHAVIASELALSGVKSKIPLDEVVDTLKITGELMSPLLKETSQGGLAKTKTAIELEKSLS